MSLPVPAVRHLPGLEPREEPAALEEMDPMTKGGLFHRIQAEFQRELKDKGLLPIRGAQISKALEMLDQTVRRVADEAYEELAPAIDRVWVDAIEAMRADLRVWLEKVAEQDGWVPIHVEFGFGFGARGRDADPASVPRPVGQKACRGNHGPRLRRPDRKGATTCKTLRVTDYKTGKDRTKKGTSGRTRGISATGCLRAGSGGGPEAHSYGGKVLLLHDRRRLQRKIVSRLIHNSQRQSRRGLVLRTIDGGIAAPFLVAAPREDACVYCAGLPRSGAVPTRRFASPESRRLRSSFS